MDRHVTKTRRSTFAELLEVGILLGLVVCSGCSGQPGAAPPKEDGRKAAEPFLEQLRASQEDAAWESTTAEFKSDLGRESFRQFARQHPVLKEPLEFVGYEPDKTNGITRGACDYQTPADAKKQAKVRVLVAREGEQWKVERLIVQ